MEPASVKPSIRAGRAAGLAIEQESRIAHEPADPQQQDGISSPDRLRRAWRGPNMLQRIRELAVQSANGTYGTSDRTNLNSEVTELKAQITNILATSEFNGTRIFNSAASGSTYTAASGAVAIQTGVNSGDTVSISFTSLADLAAATAVDQRPPLPRRRSRRYRSDHLNATGRWRRPEPPGIDGQQPLRNVTEPDDARVADRGCYFL